MIDQKIKHLDNKNYFPKLEKFDHLASPKAEGPSVFVSIMEGCNKYCSFCVVPKTRGHEVSRDFKDILEMAWHGELNGRV